MKKFINAHLTTILRFAPWLLLIAVFLLFQYFLFLNAKSAKKEARIAIHMTKDRGASIMHSFEASLFASRGFTDEEIHKLLIEQANRTDIHFIALIDKTGTVINSDKSKLIGKNLIRFIDRSKKAPHIKGAILEFELESEEKKKIYLVEKQLFVMPPFEERRSFEDRIMSDDNDSHEFPYRRHNPLNQSMPAREARAPYAEMPPVRALASDRSLAPDRTLPGLSHSVSSQGASSFVDNAQEENESEHSEFIKHENEELSQEKYKKPGDDHTCAPEIPTYNADKPQNFPHPTMWHPRRRFIEENPLYMLIAFDMKEIRNAQMQDDAAGQIHTIGSFVLLVLSVFSFFILRAYQKSYRLAQQSKDYILSLMHALPLGIIAVDHKNIIHTMNQEAELLTREKEENAIGKNIFNFMPQLAKCDLARLKNMTITLHAQSEQPISLEINSFPILDTQDTQKKNTHAMGIILRDLREIQKLQEEVHRQERLASVGRLAAGIAHEIRNPLGTIKGIARLFEEKAKRTQEDVANSTDGSMQDNCLRDEKTGTTKSAKNNHVKNALHNEVKLASIMTQEITRVDKVISDLLELSKPNIIVLKETNMPDLIEKAKNSVFQSSTEIKFIEKINENARTAVLDEDRIIQVLHNIFLNAIQAMDNKGEITVSVSRYFVQIENLTIENLPEENLIEENLIEENLIEENLIEENLIEEEQRQNTIKKVNNNTKHSKSQSNTNSHENNELHDFYEKDTNENSLHLDQFDTKNSIKFQGTTLEIRIRDTGKGIEEENIKNLFTPYYTSKAQGTGLGLVMVQKIVQAHNGTVHIESEMGKGTCVIIRLAQ